MSYFTPLENEDCPNYMHIIIANHSATTVVKVLGTTIESTVRNRHTNSKAVYSTMSESVLSLAKHLYKQNKKGVNILDDQ